MTGRGAPPRRPAAGHRRWHHARQAAAAGSAHPAAATPHVDDVAGEEPATAAVLHLAVDPHVPGADELLALTAGVHETGEFEQLAQPDALGPDLHVVHAYSAGGVSVPTADSSAAATRYIRSSAIVGAITCRPTGSPSDRPHGTEIAGPP